MPIYEFQVWSTTNLIPAPGSNSIETNQTNGNRQIGDTFTIGTESGQSIAIEDNENIDFEDDTTTPQFLDAPLTIGGFTYPAGTQVQNEFYLETDQLDSNGDPVLLIALRFNPPGSGLTTTAYALSAPLPAGTTFTIVSAVNNPTGAGAPDYASIICFAAGTMIQTENAREVAVETLVPGNNVATLENGQQPIRWIGARTLGEDELAKFPNLRPVRIQAGALADGVPVRNLVVSPQHRLFLKSTIVERMFDTKEVLVAAKHLLGLPGVEIAEDMQSVTYYHLLLDTHEIIRADGAFAETLYTGAEAMKAMTPSARQEIYAIFGNEPFEQRPLARPSPSGRRSQKLIERHAKNNKAFN